jgi:hypothetical protein
LPGLLVLFIAWDLQHIIWSKKLKQTGDDRRRHETTGVDKETVEKELTGQFSWQLAVGSVFLRLFSGFDGSSRVDDCCKPTTSRRSGGDSTPVSRSRGSRGSRLIRPGFTEGHKGHKAV